MATLALGGQCGQYSVVIPWSMIYSWEVRQGSLGGWRSSPSLCYSWQWSANWAAEIWFQVNLIHCSSWGAKQPAKLQNKNTCKYFFVNTPTKNLRKNAYFLLISSHLHIVDLDDWPKWEVNISTDTLYSGYSEAGKVVRWPRLEDAVL